MGTRLCEIENMVNKPYMQVWDCCCDHGLLGFNLLKNTSLEKVHFVDIAKPLTDKVKQTLQFEFSSQKYKSKGQNRWQVHCIDVRFIPLENIDSQLVIIAGVGGDLLIELVEGIIKKHPLLSIEFILCPIHHNVKVRKALRTLKLGLIDEKIVSENKRFYEIIHVSTSSKISITDVGSKMWHKNNEMHKCYLQKTLNHYQRMLLSSDLTQKNEAKETLSAYHKIVKLFE